MVRVKEKTPASMGQSSKRYNLDDDAGRVATIEAKYFPKANEFRVYRIEGDVTNLERLKNAITTLLEEYDVPSCTIVLTL